MKFIISESDNFASYFDRLSYRGYIGFVYNSTLEGVLAFVIFAALIVLAAIGLVAAIKKIVNRKKKKKY